jgi:putative ABC transport system permease protein
MRRSLRLYRWLLKLYPSGFREQYGVPMERDFRDDYLEAQDSRDRLRLWARTIGDVAGSAPRQFASEIAQDARYAIRLWRRRPVQTLFAVSALALGIGASAGVFSVVSALLLRSLPFPAAEQLAQLHMFGPPRPGFHEWRQHSTYLADAATFDVLDVNVEAGGQTARMRLAETSWNFFSLLGSRPAAGRAFAPGEDDPGRCDVAIIAHAAWQRLFGSDPRAIGSVIRVNGTSLTIVGIAPPDFDYPGKTELWTPTTFDYERIPKTGSVVMWTSIGRLKPELTWAQARHAFEAEAYARAPQRRTADAANRPALIPLQKHLAGRVRQASLVLLGGVGFLLLLACANVANLLLARTIARSGDLAIQVALGATRARLTQQLFTESVLLALVASVGGLAIAHWTVRLATVVAPAQLASQSYTVLDWRVLAFAVAVAILTGLFFGVAPALYASRTNLQTGGRNVTASVAHARARSLLMAGQVAMTLVLLTGAIALGDGFIGLVRTDNGYALESIATMNVSFAGTEYTTNGRAWQYYDDAASRIQRVPGVQAVSATESLPLAVDAFMGTAFSLDGAGPTSPLTTVVSVAPAFFRTMGARILAGREFSRLDVTSRESLAIVNEQFARGFGEPSSLIGRSLTADRWPAMRIVGVVSGMRYGGPAYAPEPQVFRVSRAPRALTFVVKVAGSARDRIAIVRDSVQSVDPRVPVFDVQTMDERLALTLSRQRFYVASAAFLGTLALVLALVGVYAAVSYGLFQRTREMGIRLALGTTPQRLRAMLLRQTLIIVSGGAVAGVFLTLALGTYTASLVKDAVPAPALIAIALASIGTLTGTAIWSATRHISRLDIADVLRAESAD